MIEEALESPGFWILGVGGSIAVIAGWTWSRSMEWGSLPFWQMLVMIVVVLVSSAFFATKE